MASAGVALDDPVLVIGGGPLGLLTALVLGERGYQRMGLVSRNPARGRRAADLGLPVSSADEVRAASPEQAPTCVFECAEQFAQAIDLLAAGAIPVEQLITDTVPLEQAEASFQTLTSAGTEQLKVLLKP